MKEQNNKYLSVYKCDDFRTPNNELISQIEDTPENISAFIMTSDPNTDYALVNEYGVKIFTMGNFLDFVSDIDYLENELRPVLLRMQLGEMNVPGVRYKQYN